MTPLYFLLCFIITSVFGKVVLFEDLSKIQDGSEIVSTSMDHNDVNNDGLVQKLSHANEDSNIVNDIESCDNTTKIDNGTALILTPLIEQGRVEEARNASRVDRSLFLGIDSYSGFLTVNSTYKSHLFFWYFPSFAKPINETPWIIWLQGGPGASSLAGLFDEMGPFSVDGAKLKINPHTWLMNHSLVFIDNPVGTGYSFTEHEDGYAQDMDTYGKHLHIALKQLVQIFPELRVAPLYVAGESYAGKYVPALGMRIHKHKDSPGTNINFKPSARYFCYLLKSSLLPNAMILFKGLYHNHPATNAAKFSKGLIIGNAFVEPDMITQVARAFYNFGMLDLEQLEAFQPLVDAFQADVAANKSIEAKYKWQLLVSFLVYISNQEGTFNFLSDDTLDGGFVPFLLKSEIKRALHVGDIKFSFINETVTSQLTPDFLSSTKHLIEELLNTYRVLMYCGHLDQMLPCTITSECLRQWNWSKSKEFTESWRSPFFLDEKLAGYYKTGGNLTWAVVRGAGHAVPLDQPASSQLLITNWTHSILHGEQPPLTIESGDINMTLKKLRTIVQQIITDTKNQSSYNTSDTKNQTSEKSIVVQRNVTSEHSIIVKTNHTSEKSVNFSTNQTTQYSYLVSFL